VLCADGGIEAVSVFLYFCSVGHKVLASQVAVRHSICHVTLLRSVVYVRKVDGRDKLRLKSVRRADDIHRYVVVVVDDDGRLL